MPMYITYDQFMAALGNSAINEKIDTIEKKPKVRDDTPRLYKRALSGKYDKGTEFPITIPARLLGGEDDMPVSISLDMSILNDIILYYDHANVPLRKRLTAYSQWYDKFNKLIFHKLKPEADACLFLAAVAFTSTRTALAQNVLEAAKVFAAVKHDFEVCPESLHILTDNKTKRSNIEKYNLAVQELANNSAYAGLLLKKLDYIKTKKGTTKLSDGTWEQIENSFHEITVDNSKIPNCNLFVQYYLKNEGKITQKQLVLDVTKGMLGIGGTKVGSFFLNLMDPGFEWQGNGKTLSSATIDTWMIRVFFRGPIFDLVHGDLSQDIVNKIMLEFPEYADDSGAHNAEFDEKLTQLLTQMTTYVTDKLLSDDTIRINLIQILNDEATKLKMKAYQLQALAWVVFRKRENEKKNNPRVETVNMPEVVKYAKAVTKDISEFQDTGLNDLTRAIKVLAETPRFFFGPKNITHNRDSFANRKDYQSITNNPPTKNSKKLPDDGPE